MMLFVGNRRLFKLYLLYSLIRAFPIRKHFSIRSSLFFTFKSRNLGQSQAGDL